MKLVKLLDSLINRLAKNYTLWIVAGVVVLAIVGYKLYATVFVRLPEPPVYSTYFVLPPQRAEVGGQYPQTGYQGPRDQWTDAQRERYYQTSQGSLVMPYAWFRAVEWRTSHELFASPHVQARYGLLPNNDLEYNKDLMPVGIVKNIVRDEYVKNLGEGQKEWASISCAACHTGQLLYQGNAMRIDGGQSFWNFDKWSGDMVFSLMLTSTVPSRFERFCTRVNGLPENAVCSKEAKATLRQQLKTYFNSDLVNGAIIALLRHTYPTTEGFTRTSALGRGVNGEFGPLDVCSGPFDRHCYRNVNVNTGPVSFPPLWYTHEFDWVQSPAAIRQPLGRNVTEAWGVSVRVELKDPAKRWGATANIDDMFWMETLLSVLQAPEWPSGVLGPINKERAARGRYLYEQAVWDKALPAEQAELPANKDALVLGPNPERPKTGYCARCHAPAFEPDAAYAYAGGLPPAAPNQYRRFLQLPLYRQEVMDTDPDDAKQFAARQVQTDYLKSEFNGKEVVGIGEALTVSITNILDRWFKEHNISGECRQIMQGHRQNLFRAPLAYPARPLDGYWSTGPFLHNGSVRTIYELLSPVSERAKTFWIGTREFDPVYLGYRNDSIEGAFLYDTSLPGNSNAGHDFRDAPPNTRGVIGPYLTPEQRLDILEYLKILRSVQELLDANPATKDRLVQRNALLNAMSPFYEQRKREYHGSYWVEPGNQPESEGGFNRAAFCQAIEQAALPYASASPGPAGSPSPGSSPTPSPAKPSK
jgi:hypothetical protein